MRQGRFLEGEMQRQGLLLKDWRVQMICGSSLQLQAGENVDNADCDLAQQVQMARFAKIRKAHRAGCKLESSKWWLCKMLQLHDGSWAVGNDGAGECR